MGTYIYLYIMPCKISTNRWAEVYEEALSFIKAYPSELMGTRYKNLRWGERIFYSREVEYDKNNPSERRWEVNGDMKSKKTSETFCMYYDLNRYSEKAVKEKRSRNDILYNITGDKENYTHVFSDKTQGKPYHYAILAVASLIESRFPYFACTDGDIDAEEAKEAISLANSILKDKIDIPVCTDSGRLLKRLQKFSKGKELLENFDYFFKGDYREIDRLFCKELDIDTLSRWFKERLKGYSPEDEGAKKILTCWVRERGDIENLSEIVCFNSKGPGFAPLKFVSAICSDLTVIDDELQESLFKAFPKFKKEITLIIEKNLAEDKNIKGKSKSKSYKSKNFWWKNRWYEYDLDEGNIFKTVDSFESLENFYKEVLLAFALQVKNVKEEAMKLFPGNGSKFTSRQLWKKIVKYSAKRVIVVTEDAWKWIDNEKNVDILWVLLSLAIIDDYEITLCGMRRSVFENRAMCSEIVRLINDDKEMAQAANLKIDEWECRDYWKSIFSMRYKPEK
jgi:hypothetical protein